MPTPRKYATNAERQAAYRARYAALATVREEMADYALARTDAWHDSAHGDAFQERLALIEEAMGLLQDYAEP